MIENNHTENATLTQMVQINCQYLPGKNEQKMKNYQKDVKLV